jgi:hypothetical protein
MKRLPPYLFSILLIGLFLGAGCTQPGSIPSPGPVPASPAQQLPLSAIALTTADAPAGYTLVESRVKTPGEVGKLAKDLGWQDGYIVKFSGIPGTGKNPTEITVNLVTYPAETAPRIVLMSQSIEMADNRQVVSRVPSPGLGNSSVGFTGKISGNAGGWQNTNPLIQETGSVPATRDMAEIIFSKGTTMEVLRMTGPGANYSVIKGLAETAYARVP